MMKWRANTSCGHLHELLLTNPLSQNLAEIWRYAMSAAGDVEAASFQHPDPMPRLAEDICDRETTDPCNAIWSANKV